MTDKISAPFTPVFDDLAREVGAIKALVIGSIWRFCQMETGKCTASNQTIGERCGLERTTVSKAIKALVEAGMIIDHTPDRKKAPHDLTPSVDLINRYIDKSVDVINSTPEVPVETVDLINTSPKSVDLITSSVDLITQRNNIRDKSKKPLKTTAVVTAFEIYENEIGMLTQISRDQIEDYCTEYSEDWFIRALKIAVTANKRNLRYIGGILKKWQAQGGPQHDGPRNNGANNGHSQPDEKASAAAQRERLIAEIKAHGLVPDLRFSGT